MINNKSVLAVIPARGGSKGVPLKNLRKVNGTPIVELAARIACGVDTIDRIVVSTDHDAIAAAAVKGGADAPFMRPEELSGDRISDLQVLTHALRTMESLDQQTYDIVVMLQPTSPMRTTKHVSDTIEALVNDSLDSAWTVSETETKAHPLKQLVVKDGRLGYYDQAGAKIIARQQLEPVYHRNGIAYAVTRSCLLEQKSTMGKNCAPVIVRGDFVSIDTELDFKLTDYYIQMKREADSRR